MPRRLKQRGVCSARFRAFAATIAVVVAAAPSAAQALAFGSLSVRSALNEPFSAVFDLRDVGATSAIDVGMASAERFRALGLPRPAVIDRLRFSGQTVDDDRVRVTVTSREPINEPFISFIVRVATSDGTELHEYTGFLDPARDRSTASGMSSPESVALTAQAQATARAPGPQTYRVVAGDTLWRIATRFQPDSASVEQTALAIYRTNPDAFSGSAASLQRGARLEIPAAGHIRNVDAIVAERAIATASPPAESANGVSEAGTTASGVLPPAPETLSSAPTTATPEPVETDTTRPAITPAATPDEAFGTLVAGIDTPWPKPAERPAPSPSPASSTIAPATTEAGTAPASSSGVSSAAAESSSGPGLFRTRNIIVALLLFLVAMLLLRRREQQRNAAAPEPSGIRPPRKSAYEKRTERPRAAATATDAPAWLTGAAAKKKPAKTAPGADDNHGLGRTAASIPTPSGPMTDTEERSSTATAARARPPSAEAEAEPPPLTFQPTTIRPTPRRHDQGGQADALVFDAATSGGGAPARSSAAQHSPAVAPFSPADSAPKTSWIDPAAFDLYDTPPPDFPQDTDAPADDSMEIRLDLARMYIEMADAESARELLAEVQAEGNEAQQQAAAGLLSELGA